MKTILKHKEIYEKISKKYNIIYGQEIYSPKNYTNFWLNEKDWNNKEPAFIIEKIPSGKYLKTLYIMKIKDDIIINNIILEIEEEYKKIREGQPVEWCMDFNYGKAGFLF